MQKILILDDNRDILDAMSAVLGRKQMEVVTLCEPRKLNDYLATYKPDILLMDIALGTYDGRDLCKRIKEDAATDLPVVLFTAQNYTPESIYECHADAVLDKPFPLPALYATLKRFLD
ncbi:response regulator [Chitinophaga horti]|uniref:Response regulator n=1 Tax=Chitinophaga horti TaxID=2920382 RepID=A0ABY6J416_9BACT|nr:response regulator [Chitinophaga horti]UYQ94413.1 response regulator [Chitinophaga horti]